MSTGWSEKRILGSKYIHSHDDNRRWWRHRILSPMFLGVALCLSSMTVITGFLYVASRVYLSPSNSDSVTTRIFLLVISLGILAFTTRLYGYILERIKRREMDAIKANHCLLFEKINNDLSRTIKGEEP